MKRKKICMLGSFAVGKTSLVRRFVKSIFDEKYLTTLGVKIDKKSMLVDGQELELILWDLAGQDDFVQLKLSYLRGSAGLLLVVDGTRPETLETALSMHNIAVGEVGRVPFLVLINKADLIDQWSVDAAVLDRLRGQGIIVVDTSAKTGQGVEAAFQTLGTRLLVR